MKISDQFEKTQSVETEDLPKVSVLLAALNEEKEIGHCLESLHQQKGPSLEFIVVNDRSKDRTGEVLDEYAKRDSRFHVMHIKDLPSGWLGKNHALHKAHEKASGDYLLFTDADIIFKQGVIEKAIGYMNKKDLDSLVLAPKFIAGGPLHAAILLYFSVLFLVTMRPSRIGKSSKHYIGAGVFNLVRRAAYEKSGGHKRLKLEVCEDLLLGKALAFSGAKIGVVDGGSWLSIRWYHSAKDMVRGFEKNGFAALDYSIGKLFLLFLVVGFFNFLPYWGLYYYEGPIQWAFAANLGIMFLTFAYAAVKIGYNPLVSFLIPIAAWTMTFAHFRSAVVTLKNGGIRWRETFYPLKKLTEAHKKLSKEFKD